MDTTVSFQEALSGNIGRVEELLVAPLLASSGRDVRVGVVGFSDFPRAPYGACEPDYLNPSIDYVLHAHAVPTRDTRALHDALAGCVIPTGPGRCGGDFEEASILALGELAGLPSHPGSIPLACPSGTSSGGCWRPDSDRVVIMITDAPPHGAPDGTGGVTSPYTSDIHPTWPEARAALLDADIDLFAICDPMWNQTFVDGMIVDLGREPTTREVDLAQFGMSTTSDWSSALSTTAARIRETYGL